MDIDWVVQRGGTQSVRFRSSKVPAGFVRVHGRPPLRPIWDEALDNIRESTESEILSAAKAYAHDVRRDLRDIAQFSQFPYNGSMFDCDRDSVARLAVAIACADRTLEKPPGQVTPEDFAIGAGWRDVTRTAAITTPAQMLALGMAMGVHGEAVDLASVAFASQIDAATSVEAVDAIIADMRAGPWY